MPWDSQHANSYSYALNRPTAYVDDTGEVPYAAALATGGFLAGAGYELGRQLGSGETLDPGAILESGAAGGLAGLLLGISPFGNGYLLALGDARFVAAAGAGLGTYFGWVFSNDDPPAQGNGTATIIDLPSPEPEPETPEPELPEPEIPDPGQEGNTWVPLDS